MIMTGQNRANRSQGVDQKRTSKRHGRSSGKKLPSKNRLPAPIKITDQTMPPRPFFIARPPLLSLPYQGAPESCKLQIRSEQLARTSKRPQGTLQSTHSRKGDIPSGSR